MILFLVLLIPQETVVRDNVAVIEINYFYSDTTGDLIFKQYIFWRWGEGEHYVIAWRMVKTKNLPRRVKGGYTLIFHDGKILREIHSLSYTVTHTNFDPEIEERKKLPKKFREGLR